jgi:hypothetical protein
MEHHDLVKLTDEFGRTYLQTQWEPGTTHYANMDRPPVLCSGGIIHAYRNAFMAKFFNPIHGDVRNPIYWLASGNVVADDGQKVGCRWIKTVRRISEPPLSTNQIVKIALRCAVAICVFSKSEGWSEFVDWANDWIGGKWRHANVARAVSTSGPLRTLGVAMVVDHAIGAVERFMYGNSCVKNTAAWSVHNALKVNPDLDVYGLMREELEYGRKENDG